MKHSDTKQHRARQLACGCAIALGIINTAVADDTAPTLPAPTDLVVKKQTERAISLAWTPPATDPHSIAYYRIYRNGVAYATSKSATFTDRHAAKATVPTYDAAANIYSYAISAVDPQGHESPQTTQSTFWVYNNGTFNWQGDYSYGATIDYSDSKGEPQSGRRDMAVTVNSEAAGIQPYAGNTVPQYDLEAGAFNYMQLDIKPTLATQKFELSVMSRLPPGDVFPCVIATIDKYGPPYTPGKWQTYKIPLADVHVGKTTFDGSIAGTTLTVTRASQDIVNAGGFITAPGVAPGTYIAGCLTGRGGAGTYTVSPSQTVSSVAMSYQRTHIYKFDIIDRSAAAANRYYLDNIAFTAE
jgi:hypothetical protein